VLIRAADSIGGIEPGNSANVAICTALLVCLATRTARNRKLCLPELAPG